MNFCAPKEVVNMISIRQLARIANVSPGVVSRVLNEDPTLSVSDETRKRVLALIKQYNYQPTKRQGKKWINSLCVITTLTEAEEVTDAYFRLILQGISETAAETHFKIKTIYRLQDHPTMNDIPKYAGLIFVGAIENKVVQAFRDQNEHLVLIDNQVNTLVANRVDPDLSSMAKMAFQYFLNQGIRNLGFIGGQLSSVGVDGKVTHPTQEVRLDTLHALSDAQENLAFHSKMGQWTPEFGYEAATSLLKENPDIRAIIAASDPIALGAIRSLHDLGIAVPEQVQIVGFDDLDYSRYLVPRLSTFRIPTKEIGTEAVRILVRELTSEYTDIRQVRLAGSLIHRETTKN